METGQVRAEKNWNFCALCEKETEVKLVCPLNSTSNFVRLVNCQFKPLCQASTRETE